MFFTLYENHLLSLCFNIFRSSVNTFQKDHFHSAVRFFVENYDICWSTKKVWFKETQSSRLWPIQQFFETAGSSFYDLSPLLPQIFVWVLFFEKEAFELSVIPLLFQDKEIDIYIVMSHWHLRQMVHLPYVSTIRFGIFCFWFIIIFNRIKNICSCLWGFISKMPLLATLLFLLILCQWFCNCI